MCTRVVWPDASGSVLVGRNMDYHRDLDTNLWKLPRGMRRDDGVDGALTWTSAYGSVVATAFDMISVDGLNEEGLAGHVLWLAESNYGEHEPGRPALSQAVWLQYFLDNFATVADAVAWIDRTRVQVVQLTDPATGEVPAIHLALDDATGDSAIIEYIDGGLEVHHGREFRVMTNSPKYDEQLVLLMQIDGFGGDRPLPGTTLATDRFARAAYYVDRLPQPTTQGEAIASMFSVMRNAAQPFRLPDPGKPDASQTIWQTVADLTRRRYVFESTTRPNIVWVDLTELDFAETASPAKLHLGSQLAIEGGLAGNVSTKFADHAPIHFLTLSDVRAISARESER
ncbi:linear amide C-N hydrolase [Agromyces aerolatus]|uniref:linear amide C-N hydrolase n=1 Tax=Agromyces sp. LY-1074 TaxID=3074080 RepID=UPI00285B498A|nr:MULTISPECIES: linear amide C-N hydrolase [unclassified Agromyces]MDR5700827.1 linear amide C-N hydrolase [Agromyces sp. LY-1074]MDR5707348.1 linear amide C-N hydrolase [Agromyces sp. LY-1358]